MPRTVEQIIVEAQQLSPKERQRLIATLTNLLAGHAEERPSTARSRLYEQAARLMGGFRNRADATNLAADHDDYLEESYRGCHIVLGHRRTTDRGGLRV